MYVCECKNEGQVAKYTPNSLIFLHFKLSTKVFVTFNSILDIHISMSYMFHY